MKVDVERQLGNN